MTVAIRRDITQNKIYDEAKQEKDAKVRVRMLAMAAILEGKTRGEAAKIAGITIDNLRKWVEQFNEQGFEGLKNKKQPGAEPSWTEEMSQCLKDCIAQDLDNNNKEKVRVAHRLEDFKEAIFKKFSISFCLSTIWNKLQIIGYSWITVRPKHPKSNIEEQEEFKKKTPEIIQAIQKSHPGKTIEVWFEDEARIGQQGTLTRIWAKVGTRPRISRDCRFESAYIYGAICPTSGKAAALLFSHVGSEEMNLHLKEISNMVAKNAHAVLIMDRAPWHQSLVVPENITLLYLPPYSPELNPVEQVWDFLRSNYLSNRVYESLNHIFDVCSNAWRLFIAKPDLIKSIGTRDWIHCY